MSHRWQLIVDPPASGSWNMAVDEALLEYVDQSGIAVVRLYQWQEPTLSLGYFQEYELRHSHPASLGAAVVRRQSGGGAILHDHEITYTVVVPNTHPWAQNTQLLYDTIHKALIEWLRETAGNRLSDGQVKLCEKSIVDAVDQNAFLCFERRAVGDVLLTDSKRAAGHKIIGSAQRRRRTAVLQHGSVLWQSSRYAPEIAGFSQLFTGAPERLEDVLPSLTEHFVSLVSQELEQIALPENLRELAAKLQDTRYSQSAWNKRR